MTIHHLPSWRDGRARTTILDFVTQVTTDGGPDYVPPAQRVATFDNDGTLWCEQPLQSQILFAFDRLEALAAQDPGLRERQPYKAFLEHDIAAIQALGKQAAFEVAFFTHAGMTADEFAQIAGNWFATARHPKLNRPFPRCIYQPQVELLAFLRTNGFRTFIVSGGGVDFLRAFAEDSYGIPPEQIIGSSVKTRLETGGGGVDLMRLSELNSFNDRDVKAVNIALHIGRRPILAFGNSDGDLAMLRYTAAGQGARLALLLHHDDAEREFAYDREFRLSPLAEALDRADEYGITVISMREAWTTIFPAAARQAAATVS
jgi:phosphoserine phosphatase